MQPGSRSPHAWGRDSMLLHRQHTVLLDTQQQSAALRISPLWRPTAPAAGDFRTRERQALRSLQHHQAWLADQRMEDTVADLDAFDQRRQMQQRRQSFLVYRPSIDATVSVGAVVLNDGTHVSLSKAASHPSITVIGDGCSRAAPSCTRGPVLQRTIGQGMNGENGEHEDEDAQAAGDDVAERDVSAISSPPRGATRQRHVPGRGTWTAPGSTAAPAVRPSTASSMQPTESRMRGCESPWRYKFSRADSEGNMIDGLPRHWRRCSSAPGGPRRPRTARTVQAVCTGNDADGAAGRRPGSQCDSRNNVKGSAGLAAFRHDLETTLETMATPRRLKEAARGRMLPSCIGEEDAADVHPFNVTEAIFCSVEQVRPKRPQHPQSWSIYRRSSQDRQQAAGALQRRTWYGDQLRVRAALAEKHRKEAQIRLAQKQTSRPRVAYMRDRPAAARAGGTGYPGIHFSTKPVVVAPPRLLAESGSRIWRSTDSLAAAQHQHQQQQQHQQEQEQEQEQEQLQQQRCLAPASVFSFHVQPGAKTATPSLVARTSSLPSATATPQSSLSSSSSSPSSTTTLSDGASALLSLSAAGASSSSSSPLLSQSSQSSPSSSSSSSSSSSPPPSYPFHASS